MQQFCFVSQQQKSRSTRLNKETDPSRHTDAGAGWEITCFYYDIFNIIVTFDHLKENSVFIQVWKQFPGFMFHKM